MLGDQCSLQEARYRYAMYKSFVQAEIEEYQTGYQIDLCYCTHLQRDAIHAGERDHLTHYKFQPLDTGVLEDL